MTEADLDRIERELDIRLPAPYRHFMAAFPLRAGAGNAETELWDDADALIAVNRELRAGMKFVDPWPATFYCAGVDHGGCATAIDLRTPDGAVWWADRRHLRPDTDRPANPRFADWADGYLRGLREDLEDGGIDPDGAPEDEQRVREASQRRGCRGLAIAAGVVVAVVLIAFVAMRWAIT